MSGTDYLIRPARPDDDVVFGPLLRASDRREIDAMSPRTPTQAVRRSVEKSTMASAAFVGGAPLCVYGVGRPQLLSGEGVIWMLGTDLLPRHAHLFLRHSRGEVAKMAAGYRALTNMVDARNAVTLRWLAWMGFTIDPPAPYGRKRLPFHRIWKVFHV